MAIVELQRTIVFQIGPYIDCVSTFYNNFLQKHDGNCDFLSGFVNSGQLLAFPARFYEFL